MGVNLVIDRGKSETIYEDDLLLEFLISRKYDVYQNSYF